MSFRAKQAVDFWLGGLLLLAMFLPVRGLGLLLRRDHSFARRRGCAVVKLVGAGSLFLAMPSLQAIRAQFPERKFFLVGTKAVTGFAQPFGWFDHYWVIDDSSLWRLVVSTVRALVKVAWSSDHLIDLEVHSRLTTLFGVLTMVRNRIGFVNEIAFWRRGFYTHMTYFSPQGPVYAFYDMLAAWFDIERVAVSEFNAAFRARVLQEELPNGLVLPERYIVVAPACSDFGKERQLRPDEWNGLVARNGLAGREVVVLGGAADRSLGMAVAAELGSAHDLCGSLSIVQSARVLAGATQFLGIDSLLLHLARALDVPSVSVWGPSNPATRLRPGRAGEIVFFANMSCSPCIHVHETPPCQGARTCIPAALARPAAVSATEEMEHHAMGWANGPNEREVRAIEVRYD